jgi:hypothetical protein
MVVAAKAAHHGARYFLLQGLGFKLEQRMHIQKLQ